MGRPAGAAFDDGALGLGLATDEGVGRDHPAGAEGGLGRGLLPFEIADQARFRARRGRSIPRLGYRVTPPADLGAVRVTVDGGPLLPDADDFAGRGDLRGRV